MNFTDAFTGFIDHYKDYINKPIEMQIECWIKYYSTHYPELYKKQINLYSNDHIDWREIAKNKVFPLINNNIQRMIDANKTITEVHEEIYAKPADIFGFNIDIMIIAYLWNRMWSRLGHDLSE